MKKTLQLLVAGFLLATIQHAFAQVPQALNYQAVARNAAGVIVGNQNVSVRFSVHDGSPSGSIVYSETHTTPTNQFGLFTVGLGTGTVVSGTFAGINWATGNKFMQVELDINGGSSFVNMGTSQLLSVPYALYAAQSGTGSSGGTLDNAYNFGGAGAGRTITANSGPVQINGSGTNTAGLGVLFTGTGNSINVVNNNAANPYAAIQAQTNSTTLNNSAIFGNSIGAGTSARAVSGQVDSVTQTDDAVYGNNLRSSGGIGVEGVGFNGVSGQTNYRSGYAVYGENFDLVGPLTSNSIGVAGIGYVGVAGQSNDPNNGFGIYSFDNLGAQGTKNFVIDHPLDPENKLLKHFSIESNEVLNMYRGTAVCDQNGEAVVQLPSYFTVINIDFSYYLTPIGAFAPLFIKEKINNNQFKIAGGNPGMEISWMLSAERNDAYIQAHPGIRSTEVMKREADRGKYLSPESFGKSKEQGIYDLKLKR